MMYQNRPFMIELVVKLTLVPKSEHLDDEEFLVGAASIGYPKTVWEVKAIVGAIVARKQPGLVGKV